MLNCLEILYSEMVRYVLDKIMMITESHFYIITVLTQ
jgi:hypothetical protein